MTASDLLFLQLHLWHGFVHLIMDFMNALKNPYEVKLLELYLKNEQEKDSKMQRKF